MAISRVYFRSPVHDFVKAFLISDSLLYSALNIVTVLFALFTTTKVKGGSIEAATYALSASYVVRVFTELMMSRHISPRSERGKVLTIVLGMLAISAGYLGFAFSHQVDPLYVWWIIAGFGWGLALPTKLAVVSLHINKEQSNEEWSMNDALNMSLIAVTTALTGYLVSHFGIRPLFVVAALLNLLGALPYALYLRRISAVIAPAV